MTALRSTLPLPSLLPAPTRGGWPVLCGVLLGFSGLALDLAQEKPLLPLRRLTRSVNPCVSGLTRAPECGDNLRGREFGKVVLEAHGQSIPGKEMSAMQKKELAKRPQCRHVDAVMKTEQDIQDYKAARNALAALYNEIGTDNDKARAMREQRWALRAAKTEAAENLIMSMIGEHRPALVRAGLIDFYDSMAAGKEESSVLWKIADETVQYLESKA